MTFFLIKHQKRNKCEAPGGVRLERLQHLIDQVEIVGSISAAENWSCGHPAVDGQVMYVTGESKPGM